MRFIFIFIFIFNISLSHADGLGFDVVENDLSNIANGGYVTPFELLAIFSLSDDLVENNKTIVVMFKLDSNEHKNFVEDVLDTSHKRYVKYTRNNVNKKNVIIVEDYPSMIDHVENTLGAIGYVRDGMIVFNDNRNIKRILVR